MSTDMIGCEVFWPDNLVHNGDDGPMLRTKASMLSLCQQWNFILGTKRHSAYVQVQILHIMTSIICVSHLPLFVLCQYMGHACWVLVIASYNVFIDCFWRRTQQSSSGSCGILGRWSISGLDSHWYVHQSVYFSCGGVLLHDFLHTKGRQWCIKYLYQCSMWMFTSVN